jgi:hypothetical protein
MSKLTAGLGFLEKIFDDGMATTIGECEIESLQS